MFTGCESKNGFISCYLYKKKSGEGRESPKKNENKVQNLDHAYPALYPGSHRKQHLYYIPVSISRFFFLLKFDVVHNIAKEL